MKHREGHRKGRGVMVRAWRFAIFTACRAGSSPARGRSSEKNHVPLFSTLEHYFDVCVLGQGTLPSNASLDSGENK